MEKPLLVLKPNLLNALLPVFAKSLLRSSFITLILFSLFYFLSTIDIVEYPNESINYFLMSVLAIFSIGPFLIKIVILKNMKYYFYREYVMSEFELFRLDRHAVPYNQITHVGLDISVWDRLSHAGDIKIFAGQETEASLVLHYVSEPKKVENAIFRILHANKAVLRRR